MAISANAQGPSVVQELPTKKSKAPNKKQTEKSKPARILPTVRITFDKQLDILRAYAAASADGTKAAALKEVSSIVDMVDTTVSMANSFLSSINLLVRTDAGFVPAQEVIAFLRAYQWNRETASHKLEPIIRKTWFASALLPKLEFGPKTEADAITCLAEAAAAGPDRRRELSLLIDYMQAAGLVRRDGGQVKLVKGTTEAPTQTQQPEPPREPSADGPKTRVLTSFAQSAEGAVNFNVSVRVNMAEFAGWQADRIAAFFNGIAQVLAAKAGIEEEAGS